MCTTSYFKSPSTNLTGKRGKIKDFVLSVRQNVQNKFIDETLPIRPNVIKYSHLTTTVFAFYKDIISDGLSSTSFNLYTTPTFIIITKNMFIFFKFVFLTQLINTFECYIIVLVYHMIKMVLREIMNWTEQQK